ncbi:spermatogenesis- and oogenesis-specific basic helix-loop-helix-containing protein 2-like [Conger conger]|uniref:spermatogenesis- and oogenesis-specific basic helix-loop-helix-containing protein 2-like n=1 Tax=Conger conger TaxID=82655 RepID=UPI002A5B078E|nr:spermatogenesis- and oogenesis-specific basic helix-loop-helix-containing protein 2-like [Conger conger]
MTAAHESKKCNSNKVSVLLIGDDDVVIKTSGLLWETLPRFGEIRGVKLVPLSSVPFVDPSAFQLLFFHLSNASERAELHAFHQLREKSSEHSGEAVCVLVVPEGGGPDVPAHVADVVLTQPVTAETVEQVLRRCSFLSEQSQNDSFSYASPNTGVGQKHKPEAADQAEPGTPAQERSGREREASPEGPSAELTDGDLQAFLHAKKEQNRRTQIRACCERLRELLPFIRSRTDTASTLELTVKYMAYLRQRLPQDVLDKVVTALEENGPETWFKPTKAPKKRRATCTVRNKPPDVPAAEPTDASFADDFIAAHVLGRHIQPKVEGTQPNSVLPSAVLTGQPFDPPQRLYSDSGQASVPFGPTFAMNQAYGEQAALDPSCAPPVFWQQACGPVPSVMLNQNFVPQMVHNPSLTRALLVEEPSLPPVQTLLVGPQFLPPMGLDPAYPPPAQPMMMSQTFAPLRPLDDLCPLKLNLPPTCGTASGGVSVCSPNVTAVVWEDPLLTEILYDPTPSLPVLSSSHSTIRLDDLQQSSALEPTFSSSLSGPPQWDFGYENGPVFPLQPYLLESTPAPSSSHQIPAQSDPDPGSVDHFLGEVSTTRLYSQHYPGASEFQIN